MRDKLAKQEKGEIVTVGKQRYLPSTLAEFLTIYGIKKVKRDLLNVKTVKQALAVQTPTIGELKRTYGEVQIEAYIKLWIIELNELLNVTRPLTEAQIDECSMLIMAEFVSISIADINIIFKDAKLGKYGKLYGTLSIDMILSWFGDYFNTRCNTAGEMTRAEHDRVKYGDEKVYGNSRNSTKYKEEMRQAVQDYNLNKMKQDFKEQSKGNEKG